MNESEFRRLVRSAIGRPPPPPAPRGLHAALVARIERRRHRIVTAVAFGLAAVVVVVLFGGYRLLSAGQRPTTPVAPPTAVPTATPTAAPTAAPTASPTPTPSPTDSSPGFTSFPLPSSANPIPSEAVAGPDGAVWYTDAGNPSRVVRIAPDGTSRVFPLPGVPFDAPAFIAAGPDGALWFTRPTSAHIARMSVDGQYTDYALAVGSEPIGIVAGPDGALWFTEEAGNKIGRITTSGHVSEFALPSRASVQCGQLCPDDIAVGPDGALWFVDIQLGGAGGIGRITTAGAVTLYPAPGASRIVAGPDGNLWFADTTGIGRITPAGQIAHFAVPGLSQAPAAVRAVVAGPDGAIWFTLDQAPGNPNPAATTRPGQLGRIAPDGAITLYTPPGEGTSGPIVLGPDGNLWAFGHTTVTRVTLS